MHAQKTLAAFLALSLFAPDSLLAAAPADGQLDISFSGDGKLVVPFDMGTTDTDQGFDAVADSSGRTYIVGTVSTDAGSRIGITRLKADGSVDDTYGEELNGVVGPNGSGFTITGVTAALDPQGFLLVGGTVNVDNNNDFAVCRFNSAGLPASFVGSNLSCVQHGFDLSPSANADRVFDMAVQSDGKIVLAGSATSSISPLVVEGAVMRLDADGTRDDAFGVGGRLRMLPADQTQVRFKSVAIQANNKIVLAGECHVLEFGDSDTCAARVTPAGQPDPTFFNAEGFRNYFAFLDSDRDASFDSIALIPNPAGSDADQAFVVVGKIEKNGGGFNGLIARIKTAGALDNGISPDGFIVDSFGAGRELTDVEVENSGSITVTGTQTLANDERVFYASRFLQDGSRDFDSFAASAGAITVPVLAQAKNDIASAMVFHQNRMVIVGSVERVSPGDFDFGVVALQRDLIFRNGVQLLD